MYFVGKKQWMWGMDNLYTHVCIMIIVISIITCDDMDMLNRCTMDAMAWVVLTVSLWIVNGYPVDQSAIWPITLLTSSSCTHDNNTYTLLPHLYIWAKEAHVVQYVSQWSFMLNLHRRSISHATQKREKSFMFNYLSIFKFDDTILSIYLYFFFSKLNVINTNTNF